jgi:membrane protein implicated in regulation of membrane protease activity
VGPICILLYTLPLTPTPPLPLAAASLPFLFDLSNITKIKILLLPPLSLFLLLLLEDYRKRRKKRQ